MSMPRDFTVNGIGLLGIIVQDQGRHEPLQENTSEFTGLAFAIHAGVSILEKPQGRQSLREVGLNVVQAWANRPGGFKFGGDLNQMPRYVDAFLQAIRNDFPRVILSDVGGPDVIAETRRIPGTPGWNGNLFQYKPKSATGIIFNKRRVHQMASAANQSSWSTNGKKMASRYRTFLFMLAVATAHELTHCFVGYLAQGQDSIGSYTPPRVTFLNYTGVEDENGDPQTGESGRWLENYLFGGSIEFYKDTSDDSDQAGIPYILNSRSRATKIHPDCVLQLVTKINEFRDFPFKTSGKPLSYQDRRAKGLLSLGSTDATGVQASGTFMRALREGPRILHNISASELCRVPLEPRRVLRTSQVVY